MLLSRDIFQYLFGAIIEMWIRKPVLNWSFEKPLGETLPF